MPVVASVSLAAVAEAIRLNSLAKGPDGWFLEEVPSQGSLPVLIGVRVPENMTSSSEQDPELDDHVVRRSCPNQDRPDFARQEELP